MEYELLEKMTNVKIDIDAYIDGVRRHGNLEREIKATLFLMRHLYNFQYYLYYEDPDNFRERERELNRIFRALLCEKTTQEQAKSVCQNNSSSTENRSTSPAYNPPARIRIRDILKQ